MSTNSSASLQGTRSGEPYTLTAPLLERARVYIQNHYTDVTKGQLPPLRKADSKDLPHLLAYLTRDEQLTLRLATTFGASEEYETLDLIAFGSQYALDGATNELSDFFARRQHVPGTPYTITHADTSLWEHKDMKQRILERYPSFKLVSTKRHISMPMKASTVQLTFHPGYDF